MIKYLRSATDTLPEVALYYVVILLVSASVFAVAEGVGWWESLYWAGVTSTTIGYGDISPTTLVGRIDALVTAGLSVFFIVPLIIVRLVEILCVSRDAWTHDEQEEIKRQLDDIQELLQTLIAKE